MKWETVRLGDIAEFSNGLNFDKSAYSNGIKLIGVSNFGNRFSPDFSELSEVSAEVVREADLLQDGDIVFVRSNGNKELVGRCMLIAEAIETVTYSGFVIRCRLHDQNKYDPVYFTYHFKNKTFRQAMAGTAVGANIQNLSQGRLSSYTAVIPDIDSQHRIAGVLSAYDTLIENNQKQIKLLEDAAQRLYKEWFIDLRFPGHESTPIHDGIPEGWERYPFSQKVSVMSGGTPKTEVKEYYGGSIPFYSPKDHNGSFFAFQTATTITEAGLANCNSPLYPENTIIITARGTVGKTVILAVPMAMNQSCYALKCDELNMPYYLFFALNAEVQKLRTMSNGGVFDTIIVKTFDNIEITFPAKNLAASFEKTISPIMEQIKTKMREIMTLTEARDRLLPKLMSGEIEV